MEYEFHPLANIFPLMSEEEIDALGADMLEHGGQRESIALYEGKILDGRNRYLACKRHGIEPRFINQLPADPVAFVVSANLHRRQLNAGQRALVVETLAIMRQGERTDLEPSATIAKRDQATVAKLGKVSPRTMSTAKALKRDAIPAVVHAVKRGDVPIAQAAAFAKQEPPLDQARLIAEHGSPAAAVAATVKAKADRAMSKMPRPGADPKLAADRAEGRSRPHLDAEFEQRVLAECQKRLEEAILPSFNKTLAVCLEVIKAREGVMDKKTFTLIRSCLHTDSRKSVSDQKLNEAFRLFSEMELRLLDETQHPTPKVRMPRTYEEMMALKRKVSEERAAKRAAQRSAT